MSLQRLQRETTSTEFLELCVFYDEHYSKMFDPLHHYLAQIAWAIFKTQTEKSWAGKIKDFILDFVSEGTEQAPKISKEEAAQYARAKWIRPFAAIAEKMTKGKK